MDDEDRRLRIMLVAPPTPLRQGLVRPVTVEGSGLTREQIRWRGWRRTSHGFYVPPGTPTDDVEQRIVEASVVSPWGGAVSGWASLRWQGARWFSGTDPAGAPLPVDVCTSTHDVRRQPGIAVSGEGLKPALLHWVDGVRVTDARYAVSFLMRYAESRRAAMVELEKTVFHDLVSLEEVAGFLATQNGWTGIPQAREALARADENSWSPQEVVMRDVWEVLAALPRPLTNRPVFDLEGRHVATPDLIDPDSGVYGEYDGEVHLGRERRDHDLVRDGRLRHHDLEGVTMTAADTARPAAFVERLTDAYRRAERHAVADRTWTLEQPDWWVPTETVAQRRALDDRDRERWLRRRRAA